MSEQFKIAVIRGDGIGGEVAAAALAVVDAASARAGGFKLCIEEIQAGAAFYKESGQDIETGGEERAGRADAIFLGAIGLPSVRLPDGTEISPHLRLRDRFELYAGVRPVKAYRNGPVTLADQRSQNIDLVILRESTEGLFYSAAVHGRSQIIDDLEVRDTLRITRNITQKLHRFGFELARKRKSRGSAGKLTCVDKANVFASMAFFRRIYDEVSADYPDIQTDYAYVDAQALNLIRKPWEYDVLVMENMFGDILSDLGGALVGGMGMAACGEIGDETGLFQPAHGSAPDIAGQDLANPLAAILSAALMLDYLADKSGNGRLASAARMIENAIDGGFEQNRLQPAEFGKHMGTKAMTRTVIDIIKSSDVTA